MAESKTYNMNVRPSQYKVASETSLGVWYTVELDPQCSCPHFARSHRDNASHDKHIIKAMKQYLAERGYDVVPADV